MSSDHQGRGLRVFGRVQGVGYRWWTREQATQLGLRGSVRNLADGSVEIRVFGPGSELDELERRLESGPAAAVVERVERFTLSDPTPHTVDFQISH